MPVDNEGLYTEFPARTIGGPSGDYALTCDVSSGEWAEFIVQAIANGAGGVSNVFVSGNSKSPVLKYDGTTTAKLTDGNDAKGYAYSLLANTTQPDPMGGIWERITHSQKQVFVRIDAAASTSCYVTIRFRIRKLTTIPGPATTVHPDHMEDMNTDRADIIRQRLGIEKEIEDGEGHNTVPTRAKNMKELMKGQR